MEILAVEVFRDFHRGRDTLGLMYLIDRRFSRWVFGRFQSVSFLELSITILAVSVFFPSSGLWGAEQEFRAARSVHLSYPAPDGKLFYNEVVVENSVNGSYFMACGWNTGYFGIQQLDSPEEKVVLFSVWDPTKGDDPGVVKSEDRVEVLYEGEGVRVKRFGGEGTGGQCMWKQNWQIGQTNRFLVGAQTLSNKTSFTAWFYAGEAWKKLATFRTRTGGLPLKGCYSFIEDFRRDGKSVHESRRARFGPGWVQTTSGEWTPLLKARFTASGAEWESKDNIDAGIKGTVFFLETGGDTRMSRELRSVMELPANLVKPPELLLRHVSSLGGA